MVNPNASKTARQRPPISPPGARWVLRIAAVLALLLLTAYLLLPLAAERWVLPGIFEAAGIREADLSVQRLDLFGLDAGALRIGPETAPGISVLSVSAAYRPGGLLKGHIARLTLAGVRIRVREKAGGGFAIPGLPETDGGPSAPPKPPPVSIAAIRIERGELIIEREGRHLRLPFEAVITPESDMAAYDGTLRLELTDRWATVNARVDLAANRLSADWNAEGIRLGFLGRRAGLTPGLHLSGRGQTRGRLQGRLTPLVIDQMEATFRHSPCRLIWDAIRLDLSGAGDSEDMQVRITKNDDTKWSVVTSPVRVAASGGRGIFRLTGALGGSEGGELAWQGRLEAVMAFDPRGRELPGIQLRPQVFMTTAQFTPGGRWQVGLEKAVTDTPGENLTMAASEKRTADADLVGFEGTAEGDGKSFAADVRWRLPGFATTLGGVKIAMEEVEGQGRYRAEQGAGNAHLAVTLAALTVRGDGLDGRLGHVRWEGDGRIAPDTPLQVAGELSVRGGQGRMSEPAVAAAGFSGRLPFVWPPPEKGSAGAFALDAVNWDGKALGSVTGRLWQTVSGVAFKAHHANRLLPALRVEAEGSAGLDPASGGSLARVRWTAERPADAAPLILSDLMSPAPEVPITLGGRLFARGEMAYDGILNGFVSAGIEAGRLQVDEQGLVIEGLATALHIPDIGRLRSAPGQSLSFETVSFGAIRAADGRLGYQIEPGGVFFLEGGRFQWCGGTVVAPASRFISGEDRYALTVFCDRLRLDRLLEQLGLAEVEGGGAISGVIPVALDQGRVIFDNAFLYSTPGEGGVIRVQGSEVLTAGIPQGTPQYNQIELARHALKDYDYEWAKITMNTMDENLLVQLQFDGKPAGPLPFVYDPAAGGFVRTDPGAPGSIFQGIRLDVNVTLPLNRMLRYRELFQQLQ